MSLFGAIDTAGSGLVVYRKWLDAVSDNIANINTVRPTNLPAFQARYVVAQAVDDGNNSGVVVAGAKFGDPQGRLVYEPNNPLADRNGMVRYPDIDMADQMTQLIMAQRAYQANITVAERAQATYEQALQIGK